MKTGVGVAAAAGILIAGTALADAGPWMPGMPVWMPAEKVFLIDTSHFLKADGAPELTQGPVARGQVFLRQKLAFAQTGTLHDAVTLTGKLGKVTLPAGTPMFGGEAQGPQQPQPGAMMWCTLPGKIAITCIIHGADRTVWTQGQDPTFRGFLFLHGTEDTAPDPVVDEAPLTVKTEPMSVEYSVGDLTVKLPPGGMKDVPEAFRKPATMAVGFHFVRGEDGKYGGTMRYTTTADIIVRIAGNPDVRLHPQEGDKPFVVQ